MPRLRLDGKVSSPAVMWGDYLEQSTSSSKCIMPMTHYPECRTIISACVMCIRSVIERLQTGSEDTLVLDRSAPLRRLVLRDFGDAYKCKPMTDVPKTRTRNMHETEHALFDVRNSLEIYLAASRYDTRTSFSRELTRTSFS